MSTDGTTNQNAPTRREFAERLRQETLGVRLEKAQFGLSRTVTDEQRERMRKTETELELELTGGKPRLKRVA